MRARKLMVVVALAAFGAAACGSSSKPSTTATTATSAGTAASSGSPTTTPASSATNAPKSYTGAAAGSFCGYARTDSTAFKGTGAAGTPPEDLKATYAKVLPALQRTQAAAPAAIKQDFATFVAGYTNVVHALAAVGYDATKLRAAMFAPLQTSQFKAAGTRIRQYLTQVCHIAPTT